MAHRLKSWSLQESRDVQPVESSTLGVSLAVLESGIRLPTPHGSGLSVKHLHKRFTPPRRIKPYTDSDGRSTDHLPSKGGL